MPFALRYHALQHGGIVRAANAALSCRATKTLGSGAVPCTSARQGAAPATNDAFDLVHVDVDNDPNTFNSSRAEVRIPRGARVSYARLYWGGNLLAGDHRPAVNNGRVLLAEPGGSYREVLADSTVGHRVAEGADAFHASADVTGLVRGAGPGQYTVAQINGATGRSPVGAWAGWTLVVAYEKSDEPLRHLAVWDGFDTVGADAGPLRVGLGGLAVPKDAAGLLGMVAYDGDQGTEGDSLTVETGRGSAVLGDPANSPDDVMNSSITDFGRGPIGRTPGHKNTLGYDSDVFDLRGALRHGADRVNVGLTTRKDTVWLGALFLQADSRN